MENKKSIRRVDDTLKHIAFIMDGNGRWAQKRGLPREVGHKYGAKTFQEVVKYCRDLGLKAVTVYAFSTENWKRPQSEVSALMTLFESYIDDCIASIKDYNVKIKFIGDMSCFKDSFGDKIARLEKISPDDSMILNIAINYGGRAELAAAFNKLMAEGKTNVSERDISDAIYTSGCPDPDLVVRTGGDIRISNFLLWQSAYSEFFFTDTLWPDMSPKIIDEAIDNFYKRKRRYGGL